MAFVHTPHKLLDTIMARRSIKNDAALAAALECAPPVVSKLRNRTLPLGSTLILRMHENFGMAVAEIRELAEA